MKKNFVSVVSIMLVSAIVLTLASCNLFKKDAEPTTSVEPTTEAAVAQDSKYTSMASYSQIVKNLVVPEILIDSDDAKKANEQIKALFDKTYKDFESLSAKGANAPQLGYQSAVFKNVVSVMIIKNQGVAYGGQTEYLTFCLNTESGSFVSTDEIFKICSCTVDMVRERLKLERTSFFIYWDSVRHQLPSNKKLADYVADDLARFDSAQKADSLGKYVNAEGEIALFFERSVPGTKNSLRTAPFYPLEDDRLFAMRNKADDAGLIVLNNPAEAVVTAAKVKESIVADNGGEKLLVTAVEDGTDIRIQRVTYDTNWKKYVVNTEIQRTNDMKAGESLSLEAKHVKTGGQMVRVMAICNGNISEYVVVVNEKYGTPKIEYAMSRQAQGVELSQNSNILYLAKAMVLESHLKAIDLAVSADRKVEPLFYGQQGYYEWRIIASALSFYHSTSSEVGGKIVVPETMLTSYAAALFRGDSNLQTMPSLMTGKKTIVVDAKTQQYTFEPIKYDGIRCDFVKLIEDPESGANGMVFTVNDSTTGLFTTWNVFIQQNASYDVDDLFNFNIGGCVCTNQVDIENYVPATTVTVPPTTTVVGSHTSSNYSGVSVPTTVPASSRQPQSYATTRTQQKTTEPQPTTEQIFTNTQGKRVYPQDTTIPTTEAPVYTNTQGKIISGPNE